MTCDAAKNRLLSLPDPRRAPDDVRGHLAGCPGCRAYQAGLARLDRLVAAVPVPPPSDEVKAAFLDRVTAAGPIIRQIPTVPRRDSGWHLPATVRGAPVWQTAAGLAAAALVAVGWLAAGKGRKGPDVAEATRPPHGLLSKEVGRVAALSKAATPRERLAVWKDFAADLSEEMTAVHLHAHDGADLQALAKMYDKAVGKGLTAQARQLSPADRARLLPDLAAQLGKVEGEAAELSRRGLPDRAVGPLRQIEEAAQKGRLALLALARGDDA